MQRHGSGSLDNWGRAFSALSGGSVASRPPRSSCALHPPAGWNTARKADKTYPSPTSPEYKQWDGGCPLRAAGRPTGAAQHVVPCTPAAPRPCADVDGHGSHTAGTVGAAGNNGLGVTGVAWSVSLYICKGESADGERHACVWGAGLAMRWVDWQ